MNLIISFSARENGNCVCIAYYLSKDNDKIVLYKDLNTQGCKNCNYECFSTMCKYREDDIYKLFESMKEYQKVILIVPMYCGNPSSLYFSFNERSQDYFSYNQDEYDKILAKLYIIGIYGSNSETPDFIQCLSKWFSCCEASNHILGIERHRYNQKMSDRIIDVYDVKRKLNRFMMD